jgi:hypothetical protein
MKKLPIFLLPVLAILVAGCVQQPTQTCQEYCQDRSHIQCAGQWEISGVYPDCNCTWTCEQPTQTCQEYCQSQPHAQCVGSWNITGAYPSCSCGWNCEVQEVELSISPGDEACTYHEFEMKPGEEVNVSINGKAHTVSVTEIDEGDMTKVVVDGFFTKMFTPLYMFESLNNVGLYIKNAYYSAGGSRVTVIVGENRVNSPSDCYGVN